MDRRRGRGGVTPLCRRQSDAARRIAVRQSFTLLVAVVLSAQATDAGVNKATPASFRLADTPEEMVELGEAGLQELDQDYRALPHQGEEHDRAVRMLVAQHGGEVRARRDELEALPGVGRKTANVVLNVAFGEPTIAVDTHIFRVGNRTGSPSARRRWRWSEAEQGRPEVPPARPPLADPARPLCVRGAKATVREMLDRRFVQVAGEDGVIRPRGASRSGGGGPRVARWRGASALTPPQAAPAPLRNLAALFCCDLFGFEVTVALC